ncbi:MAG: glycosyltransferase family 2 protein [Phascolarctobacterium sp.]|uniref:glycosyltransferase family 2 protein n=1 Tax=Phascolarctobacterium sp. TaxID=2049039 RepID=UPI0026DB9F4E|nr:glycosyltransferase family 2 protein [Phascolarctobacterium sp.]MDO4921000.1 glycosyltransferase family 2 protein [Phascolarctobacterium sp.]
MTISIIIPCFNEEEALPFFYNEIDRVAAELREEMLELIFIDDGSKDNTLEILKNLARQDNRVKYISFSRNFGKEAAIYAGLRAAKGEYAALMDADLQDPPSLLPEMYKAVTQEGYDSVATRRVTRKGEPPIRSFFARLFYRIMNRFSKTDLVDGARDYRLMNRKFIEALLSMQEYNRFSKGLFGWVGFKTKWIEFENVERIAGETKWSFIKLLIYAIEGIVAFSTAPLVFATLIGLVCCLFAFGSTAFIVMRKLLFDDPIQGWASTISISLFLGGVQLLCIGILGQYLAKTYLETKKRPIFIIGESNVEGM